MSLTLSAPFAKPVNKACFGSQPGSFWVRSQEPNPQANAPGGRLLSHTYPHSEIYKLEHVNTGNVIQIGPGINLSWMDLTGAPLKNANLHNATLIGTNLTGSNLERAVLDKADLQSAKLGEACLQGARFVQATLKRAELEGANLKDANLMLANLADAKLNGANLAGALLGPVNRGLVWYLQQLARLPNISGPLR